MESAESAVCCGKKEKTTTTKKKTRNRNTRDNAYIKEEKI